jgi:hypothetical protein
MSDAVWDEVVRVDGERDEELRRRRARGLAPISCKKCKNDCCCLSCTPSHHFTTETRSL